VEGEKKKRGRRMAHRLFLFIACRGDVPKEGGGKKALGKKRGGGRGGRGEPGARGWYTAFLTPAISRKRKKGGKEKIQAERGGRKNREGKRA